MITYFFQINPDKNRKEWDTIKPSSEPFSTRKLAVEHAKKLANESTAEVRMTDGNLNFSGAYINHD